MTTMICKLCGYTQFKTLFDKEFEVLLCHNCGLLFLNQGNLRDFKRFYSEEYDFGLEDFNNKNNNFYEDKKHNKSIVKWVLKNIPNTENVRLLEIGCNAGFLLKNFKNYGFKVAGIEPSKRSVQFAGEMNGIEDIKCCMLEDVEKIEYLYDAVVLIQTFEHFPEPLQSLLKIKNFLKKDGLLFIEIPNYYSPNGFYRTKYNGVNYPSPNHLFIYSRKTLGAFLEKAGFKVYRTHYTLQDMRVVAMINDNINEDSIKFESYYKIIIYFYMLPIITKLMDILRVLKNNIVKFKRR